MTERKKFKNKDICYEDVKTMTSKMLRKIRNVYQYKKKSLQNYNITF